MTEVGHYELEMLFCFDHDSNDGTLAGIESLDAFSLAE